MKIEFKKNISGTISKQTNKKDEKKLDFKEIINNLDSEPVFPIEINIEHLGGEDITELSNLIDKLGEKLSDSPTLENFYSYKKAIKILLEIAKKNFESKETISRISFSKQKLYKTIDTIDENIAKIASMILSQEKNRISYLELTNNIKGLIIDLLL
ncbi:MAG: YaaR family protein [Brevinematales bacterium]|nr:YaaR family protein [Brevinematales bacterium]